MTVLSHLRNISSNAVLNGTEKDSIDISIVTLENRLNYYFSSDISEKFRFGSSTRGTILPRNMDGNSDIDYMVVFSDSDYKPITYLNKLKRFVNEYYSTSEIYQSSPTIVLELGHIKFDLVPAISDYISPYKVPAPASDYLEWISTNPNDFNQSLTDKNINNSNLIKPLIRLVKYWNSQNGYAYDSYLLEKEIVSMFFLSCNDLKTYLYEVINNLGLDYSAAQWKKDKINRAKNIIANTKEYESNDMPYAAEIEIKKLIPII